MEITDISTSKIVPNPLQPRVVFDAGEMAGLVESIKQRGILQPLLVTPSDNGTYMLIAGERRLRAAREAGLAAVPVIIFPNISDRECLELSLIENIQRKDLNPLEKARAYQKLKDEFGMTTEEIGAYIGKDRTTVSNALRLLKLPPDIHNAIMEDKISERQTMAIMPLFEIENGENAKPHCFDNRASIIKAALQGASSTHLRARVTRFLAMTSKDYSDVPAMVLADKETPFVNRSKWDVMAQCKQLPPWGLVIRAARQTCDNCEIRPTASEKMCANCPAVTLLSTLTEMARQDTLSFPKVYETRNGQAIK